jgi:hypothetical protein
MHFTNWDDDINIIQKKKEEGNKDRTIFFYLVITNTSLTKVIWAMGNLYKTVQVIRYAETLCTILKSLLGTAHGRMVTYKTSDQICVNKKRERECIYYKVTLMPSTSCAITWASRFIRLLYYCVLILNITVHWINKYITYLCICYIKLELTGFGSEILLHTPMVWRWHTKSVRNVSELLNWHTNMMVQGPLVAMCSSEFP